MRSPDSIEHYATLFDHRFLLQGLSLYRSLRQHAGRFRLWVLCMDDEVERSLRRLDLPDVSLLPLRSVETTALLKAKENRTHGEYCWTLTPFLPDFVLARAPDAQRVTYLDADLFFCDSPVRLLEEFDVSRRDVLITEHGYAPEYAFYGSLVGRFCVQFMTFRNSDAAREVSRWWQARCLEWCYARAEDGKFGDQKYLDDWPQRFPQVHVLRQIEKTAAPWNALYLERTSPGGLRPVFFHFQGLRLHPGRRVTLYSGYRIGPAGQNLYKRYLEELRRAARELDEKGLLVATFPRPGGARSTLIRVARFLKRTERSAAL